MNKYLLTIFLSVVLCACEQQYQTEKLSKEQPSQLSYPYLRAIRHSLNSMDKLDVNGNELKSNIKHWDCVIDNNTGLIWEVKSDKIDSPRYAKHQYSWQLNNSLSIGTKTEITTNSGDCAGIRCNTQAYIEWVNNKELCGRSNWRLPSVLELQTIVVNNNQPTSIDHNFFPNTQNASYWTEQTFAPTPSKAWYVYFNDGSVNTNTKNKPQFIRLVSPTRKSL